MASELNSIKHLEKGWHLPSQTVQKFTDEETFENSFYEFTITLILRLDKDYTKK